jgi:hypothetical protein
MNRKGVIYDVGSVTGINWRPDFEPTVVHRELEIIKNDLHCNAVRIRGQDIHRLLVATEDALEQGLDVWFSPELWNKPPEQTLSYISRAALAAETLRTRWPAQLVFSVGSEATLFMRGIVDGKTIQKRMSHPSFRASIQAGMHNGPLQQYLQRATESVRQVFHGKVTYASLIWEQVDWSLFDFVGVDHYWHERIQDRYLEMLHPLFSCGKPVVITEFGFPSSRGAGQADGLMSLGGNADIKTLVLHQLPGLGRLIKPHVKHVVERDEELQATRLVNQLKLLESAGVDGAFVFTFSFPLSPYDDNPFYDLDGGSASLVKSYAGGKHGTTYPEMTWEPKESFQAVARYFANH